MIRDTWHKRSGRAKFASESLRQVRGLTTARRATGPAARYVGSKGSQSSPHCTTVSCCNDARLVVVILHKHESKKILFFKICI